MSIYYSTGAICYGNPGIWIFSGAPKDVSDTDTEKAERYDQKASDGERGSYFVGEERFMERTFRWQSDSLLDQWRSFWRDWAGQGKEFWCYDDTPPICGQAGNAGGGLLCGGAVAGQVVKMEPTEFRPTAEEAIGFWSLQFIFRRVP